MLKLNHDEAQEYVESTKFAEWDGWDILLFKPNKRAYTDSRGVRKYDKWGYETRIECNSEGYWLVESRRPTRN